jgi:hypothetical protein
MNRGFKFDPSKNLIVVDAEIWSADGNYSHIIPRILPRPSPSLFRQRIIRAKFSKRFKIDD